MAMSSLVTSLSWFFLLLLLLLLFLLSLLLLLFPPSLSPALAVDPRASRMLLYSATKLSLQACHLLLLIFCIQPGFSWKLVESSLSLFVEML